MAAATIPKEGRRTTYNTQVGKILSDSIFASSPGSVAAQSERSNITRTIRGAQKPQNDATMRFEESFAFFNKTVATFSKKVKSYIGVFGWDVHAFAEHTHLDDNCYYKIMSEQDYKPSIEVVLNISIGMGLASEQRNELIRLAGRADQSGKRYYAYTYIFDHYYIETAEDFNDAFTEILPSETLARPLKEDI